jgi:3-deoxy-D-manno-octulosonic-acid transferase
VADLEKSCRNLFQGWEIAIGVPSHDDVDPQKIYIVDKVGGLMRLYSFASAAYVGGGFHHRIHNVYEALAYELPVVVGPRTQSTPEVSQWAVEGRIKICRSESDLRLAFEHFLPSFPQMPAPTDPASETTPSHQIIRRIRLSSPIQSESRP